MARTDVDFQYSPEDLAAFEPAQSAGLTDLFRRVRRAVEAVRRELNKQDLLLATTLPPASAAVQGRFTLILNGGVTDDVLYVCLQETGGAYAWRQIS